MNTSRIVITLAAAISCLEVRAQLNEPFLPPEFGTSAFVITAGGDLYAWGNNQYGQLGLGRSGDVVSTPTLVPRPAEVRGWTAVSDGWMSGAIADDGNLYLWGSTNCGSSGPFAVSPILMSKPAGVTRWLKIATGELSCAPLALGDDGNLYHHGFRQFDSPLLVPRPEGVSRWSKITGARSYHLALADNGELYHWGPPNLQAIQLNKVPRPAGVNRWRDVSSGMHLEIGLGDNGEVYQQNYYWPRPQPYVLVTRPEPVKSWKSVSAGYNFGTAIADDGRLYVWEKEAVPVRFPPGVQKWISVSAGATSVLMMGDDCRLYTWSIGPVIGNGTNAIYAAAPTLVTGQPDLCAPAVTQIATNTVALIPMSMQFQGDIGFRFHAVGNVSSPLVLLRSADLREWTAILTNAPFNGVGMLQDTTVGTGSRFFYRMQNR